MSDGGGEITAKEPQIDPNKKKNSSNKQSVNSDQFGHAVAKIASVQILESSGFNCCHRTVADALAEVMVRYICNVGKSAASYANLSGRTACNLFDIIQALEDFASLHGFLGQSDLNHCLADSSVIRDISRFVITVDEVPFARSIPLFPVTRDSKITPCFQEIGREPLANHIPDWLPPFPDPNTYVHNSVTDERKLESQLRQEREPKRSIFSLQKFFASIDSDGQSPIVDFDENKGKQVVENNSFLARPLPFGEREVSEISGTPIQGPKSKRVSVLETFAPVIEAGKGEKLDELIREKGEGAIISSNKRTAVRFRIGVDKKSVSKALILGDSDAKEEKLFVKGDKDDRKRRAEMILKESMDNPHELAHL